MSAKGKSPDPLPRKRKGRRPDPSSSVPKKASKPEEEKAAADDLVADAANALCLIGVQQDQTAPGSGTNDGQIALGQQLDAEKSCNPVISNGKK